MSMELYQEEAKKRIAELDVTDELREILTGYLLVVAKMNYKAITSLRMRVLPDITLFIEFLARKKKATLIVDDLDLTKLKSHTIIEYLKKRTDSPPVQRVINSFISVFGRWLEREGYISKFAYVKIPKPDKPPSRLVDLEVGKPRKLEELDKIFSAVDMPTPRVVKERLPQYRYFAQLMLISGLRPKHLCLLKVGDLESTDIVKDVFGREYVVIDSYDAVKREKEARGEMIRKKKPAPYVYIYKPLHEEIQNYCLITKGWDGDDPINPIPYRSLETRMGKIGEITGIEDFVWYDLRNTWASVIYNATAPKGPIALVELGGWSSSQIAVDVYVKAIDSLEAVSIAKKYYIFIPPIYKIEVDRILKAKPVEVTPEAMDEMSSRIKILEGTLEKMARKIEELKKEK
jgi:integrase